MAETLRRTGAVVSPNTLVYVSASSPISIRPGLVEAPPAAITASTGAARGGIGTGWVIFVVLALVATRLLAAAFVDLGPDETYYLLWSRYLAWSYYDHPPMVASWIALGTALFGDDPFGVRSVAVLSAIPTSVAVYFTGRILFDRGTAARAVLWTNVTPLIGIGGILATPDAPSVMFWSLAVLAFAAVVSTARGAWWLAVGLFAGLGVASKLTNLFLGPGILLSVMAGRDLRRWAVNPWIWAGGVVAALVLVPMLVWNSGHDWVTFTTQFGRMSSGGWQPLKFPEFLVTQFAVLNPLIAIFVGLAVVACIRRRPPYPVRAIGILLWTAAPLVVYMALHSFQEQIQGHWLVPVFPMLALVAAAAAEAAPSARWGWLRSATFPFGLALSLIGLALATNPGKILPFSLDPGQVIRGWEGVAAEANRLRAANEADWIATMHYVAGSEIIYHLRNSGVPVVPIGERPRYAFAPPPDPGLVGRTVLIVTEGPDEQRLRGCFDEVTLAGTISRRIGDRVVEDFFAYVGKGARPYIFSSGC